MSPCPYVPTSHSRLHPGRVGELGGRRDLGSEEGEGVDVDAVDHDLEVEVGAGRGAGRADEGDQVAAADVVADLRDETRGVGVAAEVAEAVVDLDDVAVATLDAGEDDRAARGCVDLGAG